MAASYDKDVIVWAEEQSRLLRTGQFDLLDLEHLADEIEDVGRSERRELESRMALLLAHLLKWQHQPERQSASWLRTIKEQRKQVLRKLEETPSLKPFLDRRDWVEGLWGDALVIAIQETGLDTFPETCPWPFGDVLHSDWLPA